MTAAKKTAAKKKVAPKPKPEAAAAAPDTSTMLNSMTRATLIELEELIELGIDQVEEIMSGKGPKVLIASAVEYVWRKAEGAELGTFEHYLGVPLQQEPDPKG